MHTLTTKLTELDYNSMATFSTINNAIKETKKMFKLFKDTNLDVAIATTRIFSSRDAICRVVGLNKFTDTTELIIIALSKNSIMCREADFNEVYRVLSGSKYSTINAVFNKIDTPQTTAKIVTLQTFKISGQINDLRKTMLDAHKAWSGLDVPQTTGGSFNRLYRNAVRLANHIDTKVTTELFNLCGEFRNDDIIAWHEQGVFVASNLGSIESCLARHNVLQKYLDDCEMDIAKFNYEHRDSISEYFVNATIHRLIIDLCFFGEAFNISPDDILIIFTAIITDALKHINTLGDQKRMMANLKILFRADALTREQFIGTLMGTNFVAPHNILVDINTPSAYLVLEGLISLDVTIAENGQINRLSKACNKLLYRCMMIAYNRRHADSSIRTATIKMIKLIDASCCPSSVIKRLLRQFLTEINNISHTTAKNSVIDGLVLPSDVSTLDSEVIAYYVHALTVILKFNCRILCHSQPKLQHYMTEYLASVTSADGKLISDKIITKLYDTMRYNYHFKQRPFSTQNQCSSLDFFTRIGQYAGINNIKEYCKRTAFISELFKDVTSFPESSFRCMILLQDAGYIFKDNKLIKGENSIVLTDIKYVTLTKLCLLIFNDVIKMNTYFDEPHTNIEIKKISTVYKAEQYAKKLAKKAEKNEQIDTK